MHEGKKKSPGVPQSQVAANPWHQEEEEEKDINQQAQNKLTHEKHTDPALSSPSVVIAMLKGLKNTRTKHKGKLSINRHVE